MLEGPDRRALYLTPVLAQSLRIMWDDPADGLPAVLRHYGLREGEHFAQNNSVHTVTLLHNGSSATVTAAGPHEYKRTFDGPKPNLVVFDEAHEFERLEEALATLRPALGARRGRVVLAGVSDPRYWTSLLRRLSHPTSDAERVLASSWSCHRWGAVHNDRAPHVREDHLRVKAEQGWTDDSPEWRGPYCGEWVESSALFVFPVHGLPEDSFWTPDPERPLDGLPGDPADWRFTCGADFGEDGFAYVVWAWSTCLPGLYEHASFKRAGLNSEDWRERLAELVDRYRRVHSVRFHGPVWCDLAGTGHGMIAAWNERWGMDVQYAEKGGREMGVRNIGADVRNGTVRFRTRSSPLYLEMHDLKLDPKRPAEELRPLGNEKHLSDAARYAYVKCQHFRAVGRRSGASR